MSTNENVTCIEFPATQTAPPTYLVSPKLAGPMDEYTRRLMHLAIVEADAIARYGYREPFTTLDGHLTDFIERGHTFDIGIPGADDRWLRVEGFRIGDDDAPVFRAAVSILLEPDVPPVLFEDLDKLRRAALAKTGIPPTQGTSSAAAVEDAPEQIGFFIKARPGGGLTNLEMYAVFEGPDGTLRPGDVNLLPEVERGEGDTPAT